MSGRLRRRQARLHRPWAAGPEARPTKRRRRQWRRSSTCSLWLRAELRCAVRARSIAAAVAQHGQCALGRRSPHGHRRAAPKVRPLAQRRPRPGEVCSPPGRRRGAAAARRRLPKVAGFSTLGRCAPHTNLTLTLTRTPTLTLTLTLTRLLTGATTAHEPQLEGSWREGNAAGVPNPNPNPNADPNPDADPNPNPNPDPDPNH